MANKRVNLKAILADPVKRRELMVRGIIAVQATEGIATSRTQAEAAYDKIILSEAGRLLSARRKVHSGGADGRPRSEAQRCPCGAMTLRCAIARYHVQQDLTTGQYVCRTTSNTSH